MTAMTTQLIRRCDIQHKVTNKTVRMKCDRYDDDTNGTKPKVGHWQQEYLGQ